MRVALRRSSWYEFPMEPRDINLYPDTIKRARVCQCCGIPLDKRKRKYCSLRCKEDFVLRLKWFNNLLRAVNARYATFFFNEQILGLNILPYSSEDVYSFFYNRTPGKRPIYDMEKMLFLLGEIWWDKLKNYGNRDAACRGVLKQAKTHIFNKNILIPKEKVSLLGISKHLGYLKINRHDLIASNDPYAFVKRAFRKSILKHHPDMGGDEKTFIKLYNSYQSVIKWLKSPRYASIRGVPGQWCFEAGRTNWYAPL